MVVREREMMLAMVYLILTPKMILSPCNQKTRRENARLGLPLGDDETFWLLS